MAINWFSSEADLLVSGAVVHQKYLTGWWPFNVAASPELDCSGFGDVAVLVDTTDVASGYSGHGRGFLSATSLMTV